MIGPMQRSTVLLIGLAALLPLLALAMLLWRRFYRDDPANTARRYSRNWSKSRSIFAKAN